MTKPARPRKSNVMKLDPYPTYKDSGVMWLGKIPAHWPVVPNRGAFTEVNDQNHPNEEMLSVTISRGLVKQSTVLDDTSMKDGSKIDRSSYKLVQPGDIAYNKMRAWQGAIGVSSYRGIISPAYVVQRPREGNHPDFLHYLLRTSAFAKEAERNSYGIASDMWSLRPEHFKTIRSCLPPPDEQTAIVRFLDHADEQIQRYIAAKERLIALLGEQRQALVHQAVTRGLDPSVRLKPSRIEWLGDVPEHWGIRRLKTICYMKSGEGITATTIETEGEYPVYGGNGFRGYTSEFTHNGDYVLIGRQGALCGNIHIAREKFWASEHAVVATLSPNHVLEWFSALLEAMNLNQYSIAAAQPGLAVDRVMNLWAPIPPREEQAHIATRMGRQTERIDNIVNNARRQIDLMNEYRARLIADVVTGQLDVREATERLPTGHQETNLANDIVITQEVSEL